MSDSPIVTARPKHRNQHPPAVARAKQQQFLASLLRTCSHGQACKDALVAESTPFYWADKNPDFRKRWDEVKIKTEGILLSRYETDLDKTLIDDATEIEDIAKVQNLRMFRMKRLDPRYRDNAVVNVNAVGPVAIQLNFGVPTPNNNKGLP